MLVNGEDVTDVVDRSGLLSANVNVYPIGDNVISILVRTPNHVETRRDVTIYRAELEIEVDWTPPCATRLTPARCSSPAPANRARTS